MRAIGLVGLLLAALAWPALARVPQRLRPPSLLVTKPTLPAPLDSLACAGSCLEYAWNGSIWTVAARNPRTGAVINTFSEELPREINFGPSTVAMDRGGDKPSSPMPAGFAHQLGLPKGSGPITVATRVSNAHAQVLGYLLTTWIFDHGMATNAGSQFVAPHANQDGNHT